MLFPKAWAMLRRFCASTLVGRLKPTLINYFLGIALAVIFKAGFVIFRMRVYLIRLCRNPVNYTTLLDFDLFRPWFECILFGT